MNAASPVHSWSRGLPGDPRRYAEWAAEVAQWLRMPPGVLLWVGGDAEAVTRDAHASLIAQYEEDPSSAERVVLHLTADAAPGPTGFVAWGPDVVWDMDPKSSAEQRVARRAVAWDFRDPVGGEVGTLYTFSSLHDADNRERGVAVLASPALLGSDVLSAPAAHNYLLSERGAPLSAVPAGHPDSASWQLDITQTWSCVLITWILLAQGGIIETVTAAAPTNRSARRRTVRRGSPDVELVTIRRRSVELVEGLRNGEVADETGVDRQRFRWVVSGHWRNQPHGPQRSLRRAVYIEPHLKGPDGAPIRRPRQRVFVL